MKRMMALLVLVVAVPAMAVVNFTATDAGNQKLQIAYTTTNGDLPRGVALRVNLSVGTVDIAAPVVVDPAFNTFIDWAYSNPLNYQVGQGHPLALPTAAGALTADAADFSISMGVLDGTGAQKAGPATSANLITIQLKGIPQNGQTTVTITGDTLRGPSSGVVGSILTSNLPQTVVVLGKVIPVECVKSSASFYNDWVAWGKPDCWCYERQCRGDINGKKELIGTSQIGATDLALFKNAYGKNDAALQLVAGGICSDLNHKKELIGGLRVGATDLGVFKTYYGKAAAAIPSCDIADYNFWKVAP